MKIKDLLIEAYVSMIFALILPPIMGFFAYLSVNVTELFWRVTAIFCTLVSMMVYGGLLGCCRPIFKTGKMFGAFALFAIPSPLILFITIYNYDIPIIQNIFTSVMLCLPIFAGFICSYQLYAVRNGSSLPIVKLSFFCFFFTIMPLIFTLFLTGNMQFDWIIILLYIYFFFVFGIFLGDMFSGESELRILYILFIPNFLIISSFLLNYNDIIGNKSTSEIFLEIYFCLKILLLSFLPQFLGYKIAARRRRAALLQNQQHKC